MGSNACGEQIDWAQELYPASYRMVFWSIVSHICHGLHGSDVVSNVCAGRIDWAEAHQVVGKSHADGRVMMPLSTHMAAVERDLRF